MVSFANSAATFLTLASLALGAPESAKTTSSGLPVASNSTTTASSSPRPWFMDRVSTIFVEEAVRIRSSGVPESQASSVASVIIEEALKPTQYTELAEEGMSLWFQYGDQPDATSLLDYAEKASSAYQTVHEQIAYWDMVNYVRQEATIFDTALLKPTSTPSYLTNSRISSQIQERRAHATEVYQSLKANPSGSKALDVLREVGNDYIHDFTFMEHKPSNATASPSKVNRQMVENILFTVLSSI